MSDRSLEESYGLVFKIHYPETTYTIYDNYGTISVSDAQFGNIDLDKKATYEETLEAYGKRLPYGKRLATLIKNGLLEEMFNRKELDYYDYDVAENLYKQLKVDTSELDRNAFELALSVAKEKEI